MSPMLDSTEADMSDQATTVCATHFLAACAAKISIILQVGDKFGSSMNALVYHDLFVINPLFNVSELVVKTWLCQFFSYACSREHKISYQNNWSLLSA